MKKNIIIIVNVVIMAAILVFVVLYSRYENRESFRRQERVSGKSCNA